MYADRWLAARSGRFRAGLPERARGGELDPEDGLALKHPGDRLMLKRPEDRPGRADPGIGPAQGGPGGTHVGSRIHVGGREALGQIGEAERDAGTGARAEAPELHDVNRLVPGQRRERRQQP